MPPLTPTLASPLLSPRAVLTGAWEPPATLPPGPVRGALHRLRHSCAAAGATLAASSTATFDQLMIVRRQILDAVKATRAELARGEGADLDPVAAAVLDAITEAAVLLPRLGRAALIEPAGHTPIDHQSTIDIDHDGGPAPCASSRWRRDRTSHEDIVT